MTIPVEINPNMEFTCQQVAEMLEMEQGRVQYLAANDHFPVRRTKPGSGHFRIKFRDFEAVMKADAKVKKMGRNNTIQQTSRLDALEARITDLERYVDMYTAPEVAQPSESR